MSEEDPARSLIRGDVLRVLAVALPLAGLAWMVLMVLAVLQLGQGIGALFSAIGGQDATARWWVQDMGMGLIAVGALVAQVLGTRAIAVMLSPPERQGAVARLALITALMLGPVPVAVGAALDHCETDREDGAP